MTYILPAGFKDPGLKVGEKVDIAWQMLNSRHEERARVFDPFYRLDRNRTTPGSGLGLALVKAIAEHHDATIVLSANRPGLNVTIRFPANARLVSKVSSTSDGGKLAGLG